jgi:hypothetical protein
MDLTSHIKFVEQMFVHVHRRDRLEDCVGCFLGDQSQEAKWKLSINFWWTVIREVEKSIKQSIKQILQAWLGAHFFELLVDIFVWVTEVLADIETDLFKIESSRDPPSVFIPIPSLLNSNGCARSDLHPFAYFLASGSSSMLKFFKLQTPKNRC